MRYLFYFYSCYSPTMFSGLLDEAIEFAKDPNNSVLFVYCGGIHEMCLFNTNGSKPLCSLCSHCTSKVVRAFGLEPKPLADYLNKDDIKYNKFDYESVEDLRAITYRNVLIGMSVYSNYITCTRNLSALINSNSKRYFDAHLRQSARMVDAVYNLLDSFNPDVVYTYNGRFEEVRPFYDICSHEGRNYVLSEVFPKSASEWNKIQFYNHLPLDIDYFNELREYCWTHYDMSEEDKIALGNKFYENRRNSVFSGDKLYVKDQVIGKIPPMDPAKINIAIMNSSEDEFASIGGEWENLKLFDNQLQGILFLLNNAPSNVHFFIRIHPNLKDVKYKYHTALWDLEKQFGNVSVIRGDSDISTYSLIDAVDKVICFGSTVGIESAYWGKPSILLGPSFYYYDDVCYVPKSKDDLLSLLSQDLPAKRNLNLQKYGAYIINSDPIILPEKNIPCVANSRSFLGIHYHSCPIIKFWCGEKMTGWIIAVLRALFGVSLFNRYSIPTEEL